MGATIELLMNNEAQNDLWIFGYGSLMWRPGFDHIERRPARLFGYHRAHPYALR